MEQTGLSDIFSAITAPILIIGAFAIIALASERIGVLTARFNLPRITGYLLAGILVGPFVLNLIPKSSMQSLLFIDEISLGLIAFAAGSELYFPELRGRLRSIGWVIVGQVGVTMIMGVTAVLLLADRISFLQDMGRTAVVAVAVLTGALLIARSPSSAIAIINELRARGPLTQLAIGVTVAKDVLVIIIFGISISIADALLTGVPLQGAFFLLLVVELTLAFGMAWVVYRILNFFLTFHIPIWLKSVLVLVTGYLTFVFSTWLREYSHHEWALEVLIEPLLICTIAGLFVNNWSKHRTEFHQILQDVGPFVYVVFFTLTGASLEIDLLGQFWVFAIIFFLVRLVAVALGSWLGGTIAGEDPRINRVMWMVFLTQAGVALGLAKEVAVEFPEFGGAFATLIISVVIINQLVGPPIFKYVINLVGESHAKAPPGEFDGIRDVVIFGLTARAIAVARRLQAHNWHVKIATKLMEVPADLIVSDVVVSQVDDFSISSLKLLDMDKSDGVILMLEDEENCELAATIYEAFGIDNVVAHVDNREFLPRLQEIGVLSVNRETAVVSLLDHFIRSPSVTSMLVGDDESQDIIEVVVRDPMLDGKLIRDLSLPLDVLFLSVNRGLQKLVIHGFTRLELGDKVTMVGTLEKLNEVTMLFDGPIV